jgi:hypothetical protein
MSEEIVLNEIESAIAAGERMAVPRINPNPHSKAYAIVPAGTRLEYLHMAGRPDLRAEPHGWKIHKHAYLSKNN